MAPTQAVNEHRARGPRAISTAASAGRFEEAHRLFAGARDLTDEELATVTGAERLGDYVAAAQLKKQARLGAVAHRFELGEYMARLERTAKAGRLGSGTG